MYSTRNILDMLNGGYEAKSYTVVDSDDFVIVTTDDPNEAYGAADEEAGDRVYEETTTSVIVDGVLCIDVDLIELEGEALPAAIDYSHGSDGFNYLLSGFRGVSGAWFK